MDLYMLEDENTQGYAVANLTIRV